MNCHDFSSIWKAPIVLILCAPGNAIAESEWPPFAEEMRRDFQSQKHVFESLEDRMERESLIAVDSSLLWEVQGTWEVGGERHTDELEDSFAWLDELVPLRVRQIERYGGNFQFLRAKPIIAGSTEFDVMVLHDASIDDVEGLECSIDFAGTECGYCGDIQGDGWIIAYHWKPIGFTDRVMASSESADSQKSYSHLSDALQACYEKEFNKLTSTDSATPSDTD